MVCQNYYLVSTKNEKFAKNERAKTSRIPNAISIHNRPENINNRTEFGHWEGDGVAFKKVFLPNVTTLVERVSRFSVLRHNKNRTTDVVMPEIVKGLEKMPPDARTTKCGEAKTATFDRGTEFSSHQLLHRTLSIKTFFCDPHSQNTKKDWGRKGKMRTLTAG